jgi:hypothetical protein
MWRFVQIAGLLATLALAAFAGLKTQPDDELFVAALGLGACLCVWVFETSTIAEAVAAEDAS